MKISEAKKLMTQIVEYNIDQYRASTSMTNFHKNFVIPFFVGDPGLGKTAIPNQVARELDLWYGQAIIAQFDAGEMAGLPWMDKYMTPALDDKGQQIIDEETGKPLLIEKTQMVRLRPSYLPNPDIEEQCFGIFNLDELPQAFLANQNIASQMVNEYRVGEHELPLGITICCTGNKPENKAGTTPMPTHLRDRLMFIEIEVDSDEWLAYSAQRAIDPRIRAFIKKSPKSLAEFQPGQNACPSPRSWEKCDAILKMELDTHIRTMALTGMVGGGAAIEFEAFLRVEDRLPSIEDVLKNPTKAPTFGSKDADVLYLLLANLADKADKNNIKNIVTYLERLPNKEFAAWCISDIFKRDKEIAKTKAAQDWLLKDGVNLLY